MTAWQKESVEDFYNDFFGIPGNRIDAPQGGEDMKKMHAGFRADFLEWMAFIRDLPAFPEKQRDFYLNERMSELEDGMNFCAAILEAWSRDPQWQAGHLVFKGKALQALSEANSLILEKLNTAIKQAQQGA